MLTHDIQSPARKLVHRTSGRTHGPITRLMSPSDVGELTKPFVFLDRLVVDGDAPLPPLEMQWHPHSGIATVTVVLDGSVRFAETTGKEGVLPTGSVEWMRAGSGVWHTGTVEPGPMKGFQLWVALPPDLENGPSESHYVLPDEVPTDGRVRVILGSYRGLTSPIASPMTMTYLVVTLRDGERWTYVPPHGHDVAWVAVADGTLRTPAPIVAGELAIFADGPEPITFVADGAAQFVLGSARKHDHELVLGNYSVHTSEDALQKGEAEIRRIGAELRARGTLRR